MTLSVGHSLLSGLVDTNSTIAALKDLERKLRVQKLIAAVEKTIFGKIDRGRKKGSGK